MAKKYGGYSIIFEHYSPIGVDMFKCLVIDCTGGDVKPVVFDSGFNFHSKKEAKKAGLDWIVKQLQKEADEAAMEALNTL